MAPDETMFRALAEHAVSPFVLIDPNGRIRWAGESIVELLGVPAAQVIGTNMADWLAAHSLADAVEAFTEMARPGMTVDGRWEGAGLMVDVVRSDGSVVTVEVSAASPVRTGIDGYVIQLRRASHARALRDALAAMAAGQPLPEVLAFVVEALEHEVAGVHAQVVMVRDTELTVVGHPAVDPGLGGESAPWREALRRGRPMLVDDLGTFPEPVRAAAAATGYRGCWMSPVPGGGEVLVVWLTAEAPPLSGYLQRLLGRAGDLVRLAVGWDRSRQALHWAATHDQLTGLANRSSFFSRLSVVAADATSGSAAVMYLDLDDFKPVNDRHGHLVGDRVLATIAGRLRAAVRPGDTVARLGGDEFGILVERLSSPADAEVLAERLVATVSEPLRVGDVEVAVSPSVGIAMVAAGEDPEVTVARADSALAAVKAAGKRSWRLAG